MPLFRAIGMGVALLVLWVLMPEVFRALEATLLAVFDLLQGVAEVSNTSLQAGPMAIPAPRVLGLP